MAKTRVIKKYPNRRLYDTDQSIYITLPDLKDLVLEAVDFKVVDASNGKDITRMVLLQIISEQESSGEPLLTTEILIQLIQFYGGSVQDVFTEFLGRSLKMFSNQQEAFQEQMRGAMQDNPISAMTELTQRNLELWKDIQDGFLRAAGLGSAPPGPPKNRDPS